MAYKRTSRTSKGGVRRTTTFNNKTRNITTAVSSKGGNTRMTYSKSSNGTVGTYRTTNFNGWITREKLNKKQKPLKALRPVRRLRSSSSRRSSESNVSVSGIFFLVGILIIGSIYQSCVIM